MSARQVFVTTLVVVATLLGVYLVYLLAELVITFLLAFIFGAAIRPLVDRLHRQRIPRALAILIVYAGLLLGLTALLVIVVPPLVQQTALLLGRVQTYVVDLQPTVNDLLQRYGAANGINLADAVNSLLAGAPGLATGLVRFTVNLLTGLLGLLFVFVVTLYWLLERDVILRTWTARLSPGTAATVWLLWNEIEQKMGAWVRGQIVLAAVVGAMCYAGLSILGVPFALVLAIVAAVTEVIPLVGPFLGAIPAVLLALSVSPLLAVLTAILYLVVQQLENHLLVPKIMEQAVGVSPLTVITALLVGGSLGGVLGALVAVPIAAALHVVVKALILRDPAYWPAAPAESTSDQKVSV